MLDSPIAPAGDKNYTMTAQGSQRYIKTCVESALRPKISFTSSQGREPYQTALIDTNSAEARHVLSVSAADCDVPSTKTTLLHSDVNFCSTKQGGHRFDPKSGIANKVAPAPFQR